MSREKLKTFIHSLSSTYPHSGRQHSEPNPADIWRESGLTRSPQIHYYYLGVLAQINACTAEQNYQAGPILG